MPPNNTAGPDIYNRYSSSQQPGNYPGASPAARNNNYSTAPPTHPANVPQQVATSQPSSPSQPPASASYPCPQDYYRGDQVINLQIELIYHQVNIRIHVFFSYNRRDMELVEIKFIPQVQPQIKICPHHPQVPLNLGAILILPKTNHTLNIINKDQLIQVNTIE